MCRASKTLATEWDKGDKKSCEMKKKKKMKLLSEGEIEAELLKKIFIIYGYKYKLLRLLSVGVLMCEQNLVGR